MYQVLLLHLLLFDRCWSLPPLKQNAPGYTWDVISNQLYIKPDGKDVYAPATCLNGKCGSSSCTTFGFENSAKANCQVGPHGNCPNNYCEFWDPSCTGQHCFGTSKCRQGGSCVKPGALCLQDGNSANYKICLPAGSGCKNDNQCPAGQRCAKEHGSGDTNAEGVCEPVTCDSTTTCPTGTACIYRHECETTTVAPGAKFAEAQTKGTLGAKFAAAETPICGTTYCQPGEKCSANACVPGCVNDNDCGNGFKCDTTTTNGDCIPRDDCPTGFTMLNGACRDCATWTPPPLNGRSWEAGECRDSSCVVFGFKNSARSNCHFSPSGKTNCPNTRCEWADPSCFSDQTKPHCWGTVACIDPTQTCRGRGELCLRDGNSRNFKICKGQCSSNSCPEGYTCDTTDGECVPNAECDPNVLNADGEACDCVGTGKPSCVEQSFGECRPTEDCWSDWTCVSTTRKIRTCTIGHNTVTEEACNVDCTSGLHCNGIDGIRPDSWTQDLPLSSMTAVADLKWKVRVTYMPNPAVGDPRVLSSAASSCTMVLKSTVPTSSGTPSVNVINVAVEVGTGTCTYANGCLFEVVPIDFKPLAGSYTRATYEVSCVMSTDAPTSPTSYPAAVASACNEEVTFYLQPQCNSVEQVGAATLAAWRVQVGQAGAVSVQFTYSASFGPDATSWDWVDPISSSCKVHYQDSEVPDVDYDYTNIASNQISADFVVSPALWPMATTVDDPTSPIDIHEITGFSIQCHLVDNRGYWTSLDDVNCVGQFSVYDQIPPSCTSLVAKADATFSTSVTEYSTDDCGSVELFWIVTGQDGSSGGNSEGINAHLSTCTVTADPTTALATDLPTITLESCIAEPGVWKCNSKFQPSEVPSNLNMVISCTLVDLSGHATDCATTAVSIHDDTEPKCSNVILSPSTPSTDRNGMAPLHGVLTASDNDLVDWSASLCTLKHKGVAVTGATVTLDNCADTAASCPFRALFQPAYSSGYSVVCVVKDRAGNQADDCLCSVSFSINDATKPTCKSISPEPNTVHWFTTESCTLANTLHLDLHSSSLEIRAPTPPTLQAEWYVLAAPEAVEATCQGIAPVLEKRRDEPISLTGVPQAVANCGAAEGSCFKFTLPNALSQTVTCTAKTAAPEAQPAPASVKVDNCDPSPCRVNGWDVSVSGNSLSVTRSGVSVDLYVGFAATQAGVTCGGVPATSVDKSNCVSGAAYCYKAAVTASAGDTSCVGTSTPLGITIGGCAKTASSCVKESWTLTIGTDKVTAQEPSTLSLNWHVGASSEAEVPGSITCDFGTAASTAALVSSCVPAADKCQTFSATFSAPESVSCAQSVSLPAQESVAVVRIVAPTGSTCQMGGSDLKTDSNGAVSLSWKVAAADYVNLDWDDSTCDIKAYGSAVAVATVKPTYGCTTVSTPVPPTTTCLYTATFTPPAVGVYVLSCKVNDGNQYASIGLCDAEFTVVDVTPPKCNVPVITYPTSSPVVQQCTSEHWDVEVQADTLKVVHHGGDSSTAPLSLQWSVQATGTTATKVKCSVSTGFAFEGFDPCFNDDTGKDLSWCSVLESTTTCDPTVTGAEQCFSLSTSITEETRIKCALVDGTGTAVVVVAMDTCKDIHALPVGSSALTFKWDFSGTDADGIKWADSGCQLQLNGDVIPNAVTCTGPTHSPEHLECSATFTPVEIEGYRVACTLTDTAVPPNVAGGGCGAGSDACSLPFTLKDTTSPTCASLSAKNGDWSLNIPQDADPATISFPQFTITGNDNVAVVGATCVLTTKDSAGATVIKENLISHSCTYGSGSYACTIGPTMALPEGTYNLACTVWDDSQNSGTAAGCSHTLTVTACPDIAVSTTLVAGQSTDVGVVRVTFDSDFIYVTYVVLPGWYISEVHVLVVSGTGPVTQSAPGQFPEKNANLGSVSQTTINYPWSKVLTASGAAGVSPCTGTTEFEKIVIAAHAVVSQGTKDKPTAWGSGTSIASSNNWAMYFPALLLCKCAGGGGKKCVESGPPVFSPECPVPCGSGFRTATRDCAPYAVYEQCSADDCGGMCSGSNTLSKTIPVTPALVSVKPYALTYQLNWDGRAFSVVITIDPQWVFTEIKLLAVSGLTTDSGPTIGGNALTVNTAGVQVVGAFTRSVERLFRWGTDFVPQCWEVNSPQYVKAWVVFKANMKQKTGSATAEWYTAENGALAIELICHCNPCAYKDCGQAAGHGTCNKDTGACECVTNYGGEHCDVQQNSASGNQGTNVESSTGAVWVWVTTGIVGLVIGVLMGGFGGMKLAKRNSGFEELQFTLQRDDNLPPIVPSSSLMMSPRFATPKHAAEQDDERLVNNTPKPDTPLAFSPRSSV